MTKNPDLLKTHPRENCFQIKLLITSLWTFIYEFREEYKYLELQWI